MSFTQEMKTLGIVPMNYELHVSWTKPTDDIALFFNAPDVKRILKLERLRGNQEYPFVYFISYFNPKIGLTGSEISPDLFMRYWKEIIMLLQKFLKKILVPGWLTSTLLVSLR